MVSIKREINEYYSAYQQILSKPIQQLTRDDRYPFAEKIIRETFLKSNFSIDHVYKNVVLLNSLYSTNIFAPFDVALKIFRISNFEKRVKKGDITLVDDVRSNLIGNKDKDFYSFATKYCHHHNPNAYPIYDSFVRNMVIIYLSELEPDRRVYHSRMKDYTYFKSHIDRLAILWDLDSSYLYSKVDKYLWQKGKEKVGIK